MLSGFAGLRESVEGVGTSSRSEAATLHGMVLHIL